MVWKNKNSILLKSGGEKVNWNNYIGENLTGDILNEIFIIRDSEIQIPIINPRETLIHVHREIGTWMLMETIFYLHHRINYLAVKINELELFVLISSKYNIE